MQSGESAKPTPQFETAEFQAKPGTDTCFVCHQPISGSYFRINSRMACGACTERLKNSIPKDSHAAFVRAVAFGAGGAIVGLVLYALVGILTGLMIGYVSLAVGWIVGKAMMQGSGGLGGRRYQVVAVLFTYAAVSIAAIPIAMAEYSKAKKSQTQSRAQNPETGNGASQSSADEGSQSTSSPHEPAHVKRTSFASAIGYLALIGLASPFMELGSDAFHGLIGLVILMVGIRIAWRMTRGHPPLVVDGPF